MRLERIELWSADAATRLDVAADFDIVSCLDGPLRLIERAEQPSEISAALIAGSDAATRIDAEGDPLLGPRKLVRGVVAFEMGGATVSITTELRVLTVDRDVSGGQPVQIKGVASWTDLSEPVRRVDATGRVRYDLSLVGMTADAAMALLLSGDTGCDTARFAYAAGGYGASTRLDIRVDGQASRLDLMREVARQAGAEVMKTFSVGRWVFKLTQEVGRSPYEQQQGVALPARRPIELGPGPCTRIDLMRRSDASNYFSRIVPMAQAADGPLTMAGAVWTVAAEDGETLTLSGAPIPLSGMLVGEHFRLGEDTYEVVSSTAPNVIEIGSNPVATIGERGTFETADGDALTYLDHPDQRWGRSERTLPASATPYTNQLVEAGVSADLSEWDGGLSVGWSAVGTPTVAQQTDDVYVEHGTLGALVTAGEGEGITTDVIAYRKIQSEYASIWASLRLGSGKIAMRLRSVATGEVMRSDSGDQATSDSATLEALFDQGISLAEGDYRLEIVALTDGTVFTLDAATVCSASEAVPYAPEMGPEALWREAARQLSEQGGPVPDGLDAALIDITSFDQTGAYDPIEVGSHVLVRDAYDPSTATYDIEVATRVAEMTTEISQSGVAYRQVKLSRVNRDFVSRFDQLLGRSRLPGVPRRIPPVAQLAFDLVSVSGDDAVVRASGRLGGTEEATLSTSHDGVDASSMLIGKQFSETFTPSLKPGQSTYSVAVTAPTGETIAQASLALPPIAPALDVTKTFDGANEYTYSVDIAGDARGLLLVTRIEESTGAVTFDHAPAFVIAETDNTWEFAYTVVSGQTITVSILLMDGRRVLRSEQL